MLNWVVVHLKKTRLLLQTLRFLKPGQVFGRVWFRLYHPKPDHTCRPDLRKSLDSWISPIPKNQSLFENWKFSFLNKEYACQFPADWNNDVLEKLWLYNLHYFDDLQSIGAEERCEQHVLLMNHWVRDNVPAFGNGWEPYPLSLRIVNWIKWSLSGDQLPEAALQSMAVQVRYLFKRIEYHFLGNHLFTNAKALVFGGLFFSGDEAEKWLACGLEILEKEIPEQILDDGGHFELSPMYHSIILEDMLDLVNVARTYCSPVPALWNEKIDLMVSWLNIMCHPDGKIALLNDAAMSIATTPKKIFKYACCLGFENTAQCAPGVITLENSGYVRCAEDNMLALLDVGAIGPEYLTAHSHADTLSFELSLYGKRVIVDSGTSCYGTSVERIRQRGTLAHNTVCVDGEDSSEVWSGFRVARRAKTLNLKIHETIDAIKVNCTHDGYGRLPGKVSHNREWTFMRGTMSIQDYLSGKYAKAVSRFHFHPDVQIDRGNCSSRSGEVLLSGGEKLSWVIEGGKGEFIASTYHPEFGVSDANWCLEVSLHSRDSRIVFSWDDNEHE